MKETLDEYFERESKRLLDPLLRATARTFLREGYNIAEKEFETERQYWLDKEKTDLRTNKEMLDSKYSEEEVFLLLLKVNKKAPDFGWGEEDLKEFFNKIKK